MGGANAHLAQQRAKAKAAQKQAEATALANYKNKIAEYAKSKGVTIPSDLLAFATPAQLGVGSKEILAYYVPNKLDKNGDPVKGRGYLSWEFSRDSAAKNSLTTNPSALVDKFLANPGKYYANAITDAVFHQNVDQAKAYIQEALTPAYKIPVPTLQGAIDTGNNRYRQMQETNARGDPFFNAVMAIGLSYALPGMGSMLAAQLGVSAAAGTALASVAVQVAQGAPLEDALKGAAINAVINTGSNAVATEINKAVQNPAVTNAIVSAGASAAKTAALGGTAEDISKAMLGAVAGSATTSATDSKLLGNTVAGAVTTGNVTGALTNLATTLGVDAAKNALNPTTAPTTNPDKFNAAKDSQAASADMAAAQTPEDKINALVQQTQGRDATPEEVAGLMGNMIQKEAVSPTQVGAGTQVSSSDPIKVDVAGLPYTRETALTSNIAAPAGERFLTNDELAAKIAADPSFATNPEKHAETFVDANGKLQYGWLTPVKDVGITQPLASQNITPTQTAAGVDLTAPSVISDYAGNASSTTNASGQGSATSPLDSLSATNQDILRAIAQQSGQGASTSTQPSPYQVVSGVPDKAIAPLSTGSQSGGFPLTLGTTSGGLSSGASGGTGSAPSTSGTYGDPIKTTVDYGLGPATVNVPSTEIPVLDNVTATAVQEKPPTTLSDLPQTTVDPRPVASVMATTPADVPKTTLTSPTIVTKKSPSGSTSSSDTTLDSSLDTTGKNPSNLPESFLTTTMTADKFESPLDAFRKLQTEQPVSESANNQIMQQQQAKPMNDYYSYGQVPSMDDIFGFSSTAMPMMAEGGLTGTRHGKYAGGGMATPLMAAGGKLRVDFRHGDAVTGAGDGQSDDIPAMLADGEFVFPADVVAAIGNGSTKAGSDKLYDMMHGIRAHVRSAKPKDLPPQIKSPLQFLKTKPSMAGR